jgi:trk system potassium uptake protein TrkH
MMMSGVNFSIFYSVIWKRNFGRLIKDVEFRVYTGILLAASIVICLDLILSSGFSIGDSLRYGIFQVVSVQTTTGFVTADFDIWPAFSKAALLVLMFIGASSGSTGGGIKVIRVVILVKYVYRALLNACNTRVVHPISFGDKTLSDWALHRILGLTILWMLIFIIAFLIMSASGLDMVSAFSSVAATINIVGPGLGSVGPMLDYSLIPPLGKVVLIFCMLVGRLELWAVMCLFTPIFWRWR